MDPSVDENTNKLNKLLTDNADVFATSGDGLKYTAMLMKMYIDRVDH